MGKHTATHVMKITYTDRKAEKVYANSEKEAETRRQALLKAANVKSVKITPVG